MTNKTLQYVEQNYLKKDVPQFSVGDTVDVHTRIVEGDKERIQVFAGTVIMKKGAGINETFTVRRIVNNEGVERIFPIHSPFIAKVVVRRSGAEIPGIEMSADQNDLVGVICAFDLADDVSGLRVLLDMRCQH